MKMRFKVCIIILVVFGFCRAEEDYCDDYDTEDEDAVCSHSNFLTAPPLSELYPGVEECCGSGQYKFHDSCHRRGNHGRDVCRVPSSDATFIFNGTTTDCPPSHGCHRFTLNGFSSPDVEEMAKPLYNGSSIKGFCIYYSCENEGWKINADACVCQTEETSQTLETKEYESVAKCCPGSNFGKSNANKTQLTCAETMGNTTFEKMTVNCSYGFVSVRKPQEGAEKPMNSCIVLQAGISATVDVEKVEYTCPILCDGSKPCIRTCNCNPMDMFDHFSCQRSSTPFSYLKDELFDGLNLKPKNFFKAPGSERRLCPPNFARRYIHPSDKACENQVEFLYKGDEIFLQTKHHLNPLAPSEFCIDHFGDDSFKIEICMKLEDTDASKYKIKFYPYFMVASSIFLLATLAIYSIWSSLLTLYTRLMRHFSFSLMMSFILMSINQLVFLGHTSQVLCVLSGMISHYFFLVTFAFLTMMSVEVKIQIRGNMGTNSRHQKEVCLGYLVPFAISVITIIADSTLPLCNEFKPRFGEKECYFSTKTSKFTFLYLPIGAALLVNLFVFVRAVIDLSVLDREKRRFNLRSSKDRNPKMEQFLIFFKLFVGMGFIWIFEIISAYLGDTNEAYWYFTDILNMLQGVYVFVIFVMKRNVYRTIFKPKVPKTVLPKKERCVVSLPLVSLSAKEDGELATNVTDA